ncbi:hypothetical protein, conserved [Eimeria maxima]|uniref:Uncharacterized protein n=1 Tax=Eimeria maxima TaxID=5804 RepID=U6LZI3_EIMMA|nr:hypothetical protein, conserved [Eimeria maxima]CDJ57156.1 hypothetical protein, conserved [Eimeria maxima]
MCLSLSFLFLFSLASPYFLSASAQDFEISPDILLAGSPAAMLFAFLDTQEDFSGASQALAALPSVCKTQGLAETLTSSRSSSSEAVAANVDCNLTGVDPECFLINLAG